MRKHSPQSVAERNSYSWRRFKATASVIIPCAVFFAVWRAMSWRPREVAQLPDMTEFSQVAPHLFLLSPQSAVLAERHTLWNLRSASLLRSLDNNHSVIGFDAENSYWSEEDHDDINLAHPLTLVRRDLKSGRVLWQGTLQEESNDFAQNVRFVPEKNWVTIVRGFSVRVLDGRTRRTLSHWNNNEECFLTDGGRAFLTHFFDESRHKVHLRVIDVSTRKARWDKVWSSWLNTGDCGVSPDGRFVWAVSNENKGLALLDARTGKQMWGVPFNSWSDSRAVFSPDGQTVAVVTSTSVNDTVSRSTRLLVYDCATGAQLISRVLAVTLGATQLQLEDGGYALYTLNPNGRVLRWRLR